MDKKKLAVIAIGGNSLIKDTRKSTMEDQYNTAAETTFHIADMIEAGWDVAVGHGNGPQVGFILRQSELAHKVEGLAEVPLDVCGAESQGLIGYMLQQTLQNELFRRGIKKNVATIITQVLVDKNDNAFKNPTKPIGGFMDEGEAKQREKDLDWNVVEDFGSRLAPCGGISNPGRSCRTGYGKRCFGFRCDSNHGWRRRYPSDRFR